MIKLAISGCQGKMGARIMELAFGDLEFQVVCLLEHKSHPSFNKTVNNLIISDEMSKIKKASVLIEFTNAPATMEHLNDCVKYNCPIVIGTTGLDDNQKKIIASASKKIPIVFSPNMSVGVNLLFSIVRDISERLPEGYQIKIIESHHIQKKDAPSGTAKKIAEIMTDAGLKVADIKSIREGEIVGDHEIILESPGDTIKISHSAKTRDILAQGALFAAKWLVNKKPGLYNMQDVLNIGKISRGAKKR